MADALISSLTDLPPLTGQNFYIERTRSFRKRSTIACGKAVDTLTLGLIQTFLYKAMNDALVNRGLLALHPQP